MDQATPTTPSTTSTTTTDSTATATEPPKPEDKTATEPAKAPNAYTDFIAPEGYTISKELLDAATPIFRELGLTQDQAQKLVSLQAQQMIDAAKAPQTAYETMRSDWQAKVKSDSELSSAVSGDKVGLDAVKLDIGRAYAALPPELAREMRTAMDLTGAGDHPAIIKGFWKLAQFVTEGRHVSGAGPSELGQQKPGSAPPSAAQALYPGLPSANSR